MICGVFLLVVVVFVASKIPFFLSLELVRGWEKIVKNDAYWPPALHSHSLNCANSSLFLFGGKRADGLISDALFRYDNAGGRYFIVLGF